MIESQSIFKVSPVSSMNHEEFHAWISYRPPCMSEKKETKTKEKVPSIFLSARVRW